MGCKLKKANFKFYVAIGVCILLVVACIVAGACTLRTVQEDGWYRSKYYVALYIYTYHELPDNFITKEQASNIKDGTEKKKYNIGGDTFFNREGHIDNPEGIRLVECDIYTGTSSISSRGAERIVFFSDGSLVLYTSDHYDTFTPITMWDINGTSYVLFGASGVSFVALVVVVSVGISKRKSRKEDVVSQ
ncbi:MAG: hypothetical protein J1G02_01340 [Clostridiales bacterium]|nr:hypothetical protein [Clostridiales bacterium]